MGKTRAWCNACYGCATLEKEEKVKKAEHKRVEDVSDKVHKEPYPRALEYKIMKQDEILQLLIGEILQWKFMNKWDANADGNEAQGILREQVDKIVSRLKKKQKRVIIEKYEQRILNADLCYQSKQRNEFVTKLGNYSLQTSLRKHGDRSESKTTEKVQTQQDDRLSLFLENVEHQHDPEFVAVVTDHLKKLFALDQALCLKLIDLWSTQDALFQIWTGGLSSNEWRDLCKSTSPKKQHTPSNALFWVWHFML
ncbi:hypothetical protein RFI_33122 [Reticulomyxa filosa]|uniref:Uncharacterized protein n=1 Tax=Reticulomyxa filosa TaxID=46433 RepID=X6LU68_RETFI|nr:hypothetical protein RFI_33122 [Reticulomyxa filosa]|eukprot:ETO04275.1 hypothetical protein RFI_33122 [Reticulomyxa filosa]